MYDLGDVVTLTVEIRDAAGTLANATAVALTLTAPDGTTSTPAVANTATGKYSAAVTPASTGRYVARWVATGTNAGAFADTFTVSDTVALVSLADVKQHLNIDGTDDDEELRRFVSAAADAIEGHLARDTTRKARTDTYRIIRGNGVALVLSRPDIHAIASVTARGVTLTDTTDYLADERTGVLYRVGNVWEAPVVVTWTTGAVDTPAIRQAMLEMVRHLWQTQRGTMAGLPRSAELYPSGAGYSLPNRVLELLARDRTHA